MARRRTELVKADADTDLLPRVTEPRPDTAPGVGEIEVLERGEILESPTGVLAERPEDILAEPPDARDISAELAAPPRRKLPWLTLLLSAGVVAAGAFSVGALVEKHHLQNSPTVNAASASRRRARPAARAAAVRSAASAEVRVRARARVPARVRGRFTP